MSPSFTPGSSNGLEGCGSDSVIAMSTYVAPASRAAAKIGGVGTGGAPVGGRAAPPPPRERDDLPGLRGVDTSRADALVAKPRRLALGTRAVHVGQHQPLEEVV